MEERDAERAKLSLAWPEGCIFPASEPEGYWVRGKARWYWVSARLHTCDCPDYFHRGARARPCKHLRLLFAFLALTKGEEVPHAA